MEITFQPGATGSVLDEGIPIVHLDIPLSNDDHVADAVLARRSHSKPHWSNTRPRILDTSRVKPRISHTTDALGGHGGFARETDAIIWATRVPQSFNRRVVKSHWPPIYVDVCDKTA